MFFRQWVALFSLGVATLGWAQGPAAQNLDSYVQGAGVGTVVLKPTTLRLSIPIKVVEEASWDATEKLRKIRKQVVQRASEMGAGDEVRTVGFQCTLEVQQVFGIDRTSEQKARFAARCYVIADILLPEMDDHEATIAVSQSQLEELSLLVPKSNTGRSSLSYRSLTTGLTSQQLDSPMAFFVAEVGAEDRKEATRQAVAQAKQQVDASLEALGVTMSAMSISQQRSSFVSTRPKHPAEAEIYRQGKNEAVGTYADGVRFTVGLSINARFKSSE